MRKIGCSHKELSGEPWNDLPHGAPPGFIAIKKHREQYRAGVSKKLLLFLRERSSHECDRGYLERVKSEN